MDRRDFLKLGGLATAAAISGDLVPSIVNAKTSTIETSTNYEVYGLPNSLAKILVGNEEYLPWQLGFRPRQGEDGELVVEEIWDGEKSIALVPSINQIQKWLIKQKSENPKTEAENLRRWLINIRQSLIYNYCLGNSVYGPPMTDWITQKFGAESRNNDLSIVYGIQIAKLIVKDKPIPDEWRTFYNRLVNPIEATPKIKDRFDVIVYPDDKPNIFKERYISDFTSKDASLTGFEKPYVNSIIEESINDSDIRILYSSIGDTLRIGENGIKLQEDFFHLVNPTSTETEDDYDKIRSSLGNFFRKSVATTIKNLVEYNQNQDLRIKFRPEKVFTVPFGIADDSTDEEIALLVVYNHICFTIEKIFNMIRGADPAKIFGENSDFAQQLSYAVTIIIACRDSSTAQLRPSIKVLQV